MSAVQTLRLPDGGEFVVLPRADYERLREAAEDRAELALSLAVLRGIAGGTVETVPQAVLERLAAGEAPLRVWREHRGLTLAALGEAAGLSQPFLSQIETGKREPTVKTLLALAKALEVDLDDLVVRVDAEA